MSKLNPQNATAYVGPGVLRKGGKITPVPNGPLIKKKGPFKGSTLKAGGTIKKAQMGASVEQRAAAKLKKEANVRKQDSLLNVRAKKFGFENKEDYFKWQDKRNKGADQPIEGSGPSKETGAGRLKSPCQGGRCPGLNPSRNGSKLKKAQMGSSIFKDNPIYKKTTDLRGKIGSAALGMPGMKPIVKNGKMIKRADGSYSKRGLWDNIRANKGSGKKPTKQMLVQEKKIKAKSKK